jgi:predicted HTH domain antitoxin
MSTLQLDLPPEIPAEEAVLVLAIKLYETGRLSLGQAAELAGYSKRGFMEVMGKHGADVFAYPPEELNKDLQFREELALTKP